MHRIRRFRTPVDAVLAALQLWRHGIVARVHCTPSDAAIAGSLVYSPFELVIANKTDTELAMALLAEMDASPPDLDEGWEETAMPDLTKLDPSLAPPCPSCSRLLVLRDNNTNCPSCGVEVDVVDELIQVHGPEVLEGCYQETLLFSDEDLRLAAIPCARCQYSLYDLAPTGLCPECGEAYDKHATIQRWLGA